MVWGWSGLALGQSYLVSVQRPRGGGARENLP